MSTPHLGCIELDQPGRDGGREGINSDVLAEQHFAGAHDFVRGLSRDNLDENGAAVRV
jgi:hypothetical protein